MSEQTAQIHIPPTPRPVTRRVFWRSWHEEPVQIWWKSALLVAIVMTYVTVVQVRSYLREKDLLEHGVPVKARIIELAGRKLSTGGYKPAREAELPVRLEGTYPDGSEFHYEGMLPTAEGFAELGAYLNLRVDPHDPSRWAEIGEARELRHELMALFLLAPVVVVLLAIAQWKRMNVLRIWRDGKIREGVVIDCKQSAMAPRSRICRYSIPDQYERRIFRTLYPAKFGIPREGESMQMIVLGDQPERSLVADFYARSFDGQTEA